MDALKLPSLILDHSVNHSLLKCFPSIPTKKEKVKNVKHRIPEKNWKTHDKVLDGTFYCTQCFILFLELSKWKTLKLKVFKMKYNQKRFFLLNRKMKLQDSEYSFILELRSETKSKL